MTLAGAASAQIRLIVWCLDCGRQVELDPVEMAELRCPDDWPGFARAACVLSLRQPAGRFVVTGEPAAR